MSSACLPENEARRLASLASFSILDTPPEPHFDAFATAAARIFATPTSLLSFVDADRQWFKAKVGMDADETSRDFAFCAHALLHPERMLVVPDATRDVRFADNPLVLADNGIRFYAGAPLRDKNGDALGTLCVIDSKPRVGALEDLKVLSELAAGVVSTMELQRGATRAREAAKYDKITGLPGRAAISARLDEEVRAARSTGTLCGVICLDLDRFKAVEELFGRGCGDALLAEAARRLRLTARDDAVAARLGDGGFAMILPAPTEAPRAQALAQQVVDRLSEPFEIDGQSVPITCSAGVALYPCDAQDGETLLRRADAAMRRATLDRPKRDGRGRVRLYVPSIGEDLRNARSLDRDLRQATDTGRFTLHKQPIVDLRNDRLAAYEMLLRWDRPGHGPTPPGAFIETAETSGLIFRIDRWVLREACRQAAAWPEKVRVAVNVSSQWFDGGELPALVAQVLAESGLEPERLEVEVTERTLMQNERRARADFGRLKALGVQIALDDFGSGYSSLAYLTKYRFDKIKLSGGFVSGIGRSGPAEAVLRSVLGLCSALGLRSCAEAVETPRQLAFLRAEGCVEAQGYLIDARRKRPAIATAATATRAAAARKAG